MLQIHVWFSESIKKLDPPTTSLTAGFQSGETRRRRRRRRKDWTASLPYDLRTLSFSINTK